MLFWMLGEFLLCNENILLFEQMPLAPVSLHVYVIHYMKVGWENK